MTIEEELIKQIDSIRGFVPRSVYIEQLIKQGLKA